MGRLACLLLLLPLACLTASDYALINKGVTLPESPIVEIGKNFTAMCVLYEEARSTVNDIYWTSGKDRVHKELYTKINDSAVNVTITITDETPDWLTCMSARLGNAPIHGIHLRKGYPPDKPKNLTCRAVQSGKDISNFLNCTWEPGNTIHKDMVPKYNLSVTLLGMDYTNEAKRGRGFVDLVTYPNHVMLNIAVVAVNELGEVQSDPLEIDANDLVKTDPPKKVRLVPEKEFSTSLRVEWKHPIHETVMKLKYNIRFCTAASKEWTEVPQNDTLNYMESFRLQDLKPDTEYIVQVRCISYDGSSYWSDWSPNTTAKTPEAKPTSKPDLWRIINGRKHERTVQLIAKTPVESNGRIIKYNIKFRTDGDWETVTVNTTDLHSASQEKEITELPKVVLSEKKSAHYEVIAWTAVGESPRATLVIPKLTQDVPGVESLDWNPLDGKLWLKWQPAPDLAYVGSTRHPVNLTEYVLEWMSADGEMDWQREGRHCQQAAIRGNLEKFKWYNISIYPVYMGMVGKPFTTGAYLEQGVPSEAVSLKLKRTGKHDADLEWTEMPLKGRRGFITHYTIYYKTLNETDVIKVPPETYSYTLKQLASHTKVTVRLGASTIRGEINSNDLNFITLKYAPGEVEGIVVAVCFGFLFIVVLTMLFCLYKKKWIKKVMWPDVPDPSNSTIATWSPDFPSKPVSPRESALADVSVVEVDVFDGKSLFEEDKACLPLKKDKYLSEEHSSGIGGSSCMSSPRQSVSDSDEGGDSGQTTASTVQYSSVVASSGYKGQTPGPIPPSQAQQQPVFARSESTQPLLDSEEHPDPSGPEGAQRCPRNPYFRRSPGGGDDNGSHQEAEFNQMEMEEQGGFALLRFSPLEEGSQQTTPTEERPSPDGQPAGDASSSYKPQQSGYRPQ